MKNIRHISEFLNEDINTVKNSEEYEKYFELIDEFLNEEELNSSFDDIYYYKDGDKDLEKLKNFLNKKGLSLDKFFDKFRKTIFEDIRFTAKCGFYDYMLYTYDNEYMLNGAGVGPNPEDKVLKYIYGFQTTKLGKIFIKQNWDSIDDFYKSVTKNFPIYIEDQINDEEYIIFNNNVVIDILSIFCTKKYFNHNSYDKFLKNIQEILRKFTTSLLYNRFLLVSIGENPNIEKNMNTYKKYIEKLKSVNDPIINDIKVEIEAKKYNI